MTLSICYRTLRFTPRLTLFWRLFLSLLLMLLLTSALSVGIERWLSSKQINGRMQSQVEDLLLVREQITNSIERGDFAAIRQRYRQDRRFMEQVRIIDEHSNIVSFRRPRPSGYRPSLPLAEDVLRPNRQDNRVVRDHKIWQQISVNEDNYPQLADTVALAPDGQSYTIQLQPRLPLHDILAARRNYVWLRTTLIVLFSVLVCYGFSRTLTRRIRQLQQAVQRISKGSYQDNKALARLGEDELGMLAKEVGQLSKRLSESENARQRMLSDISHELRSPLARLDVATELTRDAAPNAARYLDRIQKESERMTMLIDQIIHIQSLQINSDTPRADNIEPVNILSLLQSIHDDVSFEFQDKKVDWQWQLDVDRTKPETYTVFGKQEQLYSAFENIIRNAFEHTLDGTTVMVSISKTSIDRHTSALQICIRDAGVGIDDPVDLARIFQPFVRLDAARSRHVIARVNQFSDHNKSTGYGLGLAIAHAVISTHGGVISADNREDGLSGLVIRVVLPLNKTY